MLEHSDDTFCVNFFFLLLRMRCFCRVWTLLTLSKTDICFQCEALAQVYKRVYPNQFVEQLQVEFPSTTAENFLGFLHCEVLKRHDNVRKCWDTSAGN